MKVYYFYIILDKLDPSGSVCSMFDLECNSFEMNGEIVSLYAHTTSKEKAELFMALRNMELFIPIKCNTTKEEYEEFKSNELYSNLVQVDLDKLNEKGMIDSFPMLLTQEEQNLYYDVYGDAESILYSLIINENNIDFILSIIKKSWRKKIGEEELFMIEDMSNNISEGRNTVIHLSGINFLITYLGELF